MSRARSVSRLGNPSAIALDSQNNVGIGSTIPQSKLDVSGAVRLNGPISIGGTSGSSGQVLQSTGVGVTWSTPSTFTTGKAIAMTIVFG